LKHDSRTTAREWRSFHSNDDDDLQHLRREVATTRRRQWDGNDATTQGEILRAATI